MAGGRPSKLTPSLVDQARQLAQQGLPIGMICQQLGINHATAWRWMQDAEEDEDEEDSLKVQFRKAIHDSGVQLAKAQLGNLRDQAAEGSTQAATWLLTHHPALRDHFSDAAATRREVQRTMSEVVNAIEATPGLTVEQREAVLLSLAARGLGGTAAQ